MPDRSIDQLAKTLVRSSPASPDDVAGQIYGDYVILDKIGQGSMGQVFKAMHRHLERIVALKVLNRFAVGSAESVERFQREAKVVATLDHPNIVRAYDARINEPQTYLIMEYVDGVDLATLVEREGALPARLACQYVLQAARGLAHAHAKGVVHRDVKPSNLIVDSAGIVKVLDLGVARLRSSSVQGEPACQRLTDEGQVLGTIVFMAPEQAADSRHADERSDIYSLGCTLFYLLTQSLPFTGASISDTLEAHRVGSAPSLLALCPGASQGLQEVFEKAVAKDASHRYASMSEFIQDLECCIRDGQSKSANNERPRQRIGADSSRRWKSKRDQSSTDTVSIRDRQGRPSRESLRPDRATKPNRAVANLKKQVFLMVAVCSVLMLLTIMGIIAFNNRAPSSVEASLSNTRSSNSKPTPTAVNLDNPASISNRTDQEPSEEVTLASAKLIPSPAEEAPEERPAAIVGTSQQDEPSAPLDAPRSPKLKPPSTDREMAKVAPTIVKEKDIVLDAVGRDSPPAESHDFALTLITGKREEKLSDIDAAVKRLESFIEVRDRTDDKRSEPLPFVATVTVDDQVFEAGTPELALEVCRLLQSAEAGDDVRALVSGVAGDAVDMARITREANAYVQQHFPQHLDQWVEEKNRMPKERDVRRIVMKIISLGKSNDIIPRYIDYRPTSLELDGLLGEMLKQKSEQLKREAPTQPLPGRRPPPPPHRKPPPR